MFTELTKQDVLDLLTEGLEENKFCYYGRFDEEQFLSRMFDLTELPSYDPRFSDMAGDIWQHTINNSDWEKDWAFYDRRLNIKGDNDIFKRFVEQIFHPVVVDQKSDWKQYFDEINKILMYDSVKLISTEQMSGRPIYKISNVDHLRLVNDYSMQLKNKFSSEYIDSQVNLMLENIESNPNVAIGKAKELLESCAKTILDELKVSYNHKLEMMPLMKLVLAELGLSANDQNKETDSGKIAAKILGNLAAVTQHMSELRNSFGGGHGKSKTFVSLPPRYARLAVGSATTFVYFIWETYQDRKETF